jgi:hypothetical protein
MTTTGGLSLEKRRDISDSQMLENFQWIVGDDDSVFRDQLRPRARLDTILAENVQRSYEAAGEVKIGGRWLYKNSGHLFLSLWSRLVARSADGQTHQQGYQR